MDANQHGKPESMELQLNIKGCTVTVWNDPGYKPKSLDNPRLYGKEYLLGESHWSSQHAVECIGADGAAETCLIASGGGATGIHEHSCIAQDGAIFLAVGDSLCRLSLPDLQLTWHAVVDQATCFGVHWSPEHRCLIIHGELLISRMDTKGNIAWQSCGESSDIFTGEFELYGDHAKVVDFNNNCYRIDIRKGEISDLVE
jgi:hypothetical protein